MKSKNGFTLIEVIMVTLLLAYLAYQTFTAVRDLMDSKGRIDYRTDLAQVSRSLWSIMDRDLRNIFYITADDLGWNPGGIVLTPEERQNPPPVPPKPLPQTLVQGTSNQLLISTRSHQRMSQDVPEDEQHYVRYLLDHNKLMREESPRAINRDDIANEKLFKSFTLVDDVKTLEFKYYNIERDRWEDSWDTNRADMLDKLPAAIRFKVEFTLQVDNDPDAKPVPVVVQSDVQLTQRLFKEAPLALPKSAQQQRPGP